MKSQHKTLCILLFALLYGSAFSQTPITLQAAIDTALLRNPGNEAARLRTAAARALEASAFDLPATAVTLEYGSMNSAYADTRLGLSQTVSFPVVYQRQRQLLEAHTENTRLGAAVTRLQLKKEVASLYYHILLIRQQKELLLQADTLFQTLMQRQQQRFNAGDINILEKTTAETQRMQIANQLQQLEADLAILQERFSSLLNTDIFYAPVNGAAKALLLTTPDASLVPEHPAVKVRLQQQQVALLDIAVQKTRSLPQLSLGYINQSIRGVQLIDGVEKTYTAGNRFSSVVLGISIPVFTRSLKARIAAGKQNYLLSQAEYQEALRQQKTAFEQLLLQYHKNETQLRYYEQYALKQAKVLREHSTLQLNSGDISYIEWMLLVHQSIQLEADYFTVLNEWNTTVIELNSYINN